MLKAPPPDAILLGRYGPVSFAQRATMLLRELTGASRPAHEDLSSGKAQWRCDGVV
jgi:hypothetical protein